VSAQASRRRRVTARELAERLGSSERTARRLIAEPRADFLARAAANRARAVELRGQGLLYREIAEQMDIPIGNVGRLLNDARRIALQEAAVDQQKPA
jgi:DNA-directed RNA polymerase specialized sigma24 family protein